MSPIHRNHDSSAHALPSPQALPAPAPEPEEPLAPGEASPACSCARRWATAGLSAVTCAASAWRAWVWNRDSSVAKTASPTEPPIWRNRELRPVASVSFVRSTFESAVVVSGTKRKLNPTPCARICRTISAELLRSVRWARLNDPHETSTIPMPTSSRGETRL